jgi:predicted adenylyl cyclase CyaB
MTINAMKLGIGDIVQAKAKQEVEIKFQLDSSEFKVFLGWLKARADFQESVDIIDTYYNNPANSFLFKTPNGLTQYKELLRIRSSSNNKHKICKKVRHYNENFSKITKTEESEEKITNVFEKEKELLGKGFEILRVFEKTRKVYLYKHENIELEIIIDEVKNFGRFLEIEVKQGKLTHEQLWNFLNATGVKRYIAFNVGYLNMALNPDHYFGKEKKL